jgi:hypothetical protein
LDIEKTITVASPFLLWQMQPRNTKNLFMEGSELLTVALMERYVKVLGYKAAYLA